MVLTDIEKSELLEIARDAVRFDEMLSNHSTMKVGGPADIFVSPLDMETLKNIMGWATDREISYMFLGAGSDTLIRDGGFKGLVIHLEKGWEEMAISHESAENIFVSAGAGVSTGALVRFAKENGLKGVEGLAGIPGSVGGNVMTNAGTSLGWISEIIEEITVVDRQRRELTMKRKALEFSYRRLKLPRSTAVVKALLKLGRDEPAAIKARMTELLEKRRATQPHGQPTLGCVFKNPQKDAGSKMSAGALIEEAGLKGVRVGRARVSEVHGNFIINEGGATAKDIEVLMGLVKERIKEKFSLVLEAEIHVVGEK